MSTRRLHIAARIVAVTGAVILSVSACASPTRPAAPSVAVPTSSTADTPPAPDPSKPTIVLVHGAFEDASGWSGVIPRLQSAGYRVVAPAVPLRGLTPDSAYLTSIVKNIPGPLVLVGHSYGGMLISELAATNPNVHALVYVAALIPRANESAGQLTASYPGSLLGPDTTYTISYPGGTDTFVKPESFHQLFAADRSPADAAAAAAGQRPADAAAFTTPATSTAPASIPVYAIVANQDKAIPPAAELAEATRAGATVSRVDSAHDLPTTHPTEVVAVIEKAATTRH